MDALLPGFSVVDGLAIFAAFPLYLTIGAWLVGQMPRLVRYAYGVIGGMVLAWFLLLWHGLGQWLWLPTLTVTSGLGWIALMHAAEAVRDHLRAQDAATDPRVQAAAKLPPPPPEA